MAKAISSDSNKSILHNSLGLLWGSFFKVPTGYKQAKFVVSLGQWKPFLSLSGQKSWGATKFLPPQPRDGTASLNIQGLQQRCMTWTLRDLEKSVTEVNYGNWRQMPEQQQSTHPNKDLKHISAPDRLPARGLKDLPQVLSYELLHLRSFAVS